MKTIIIFLALSMICIFTGCTGDEEFNPLTVQDDEQLIAVGHSIYGVDSIFYENDLIKYISTYKKSGSELICSENYTLERSGDQIKVLIREESLEVNILSFNGSRISEIQCPEKNFKVEFHYKNELVDYLLYRRGEYLDSLTLLYDPGRKNIVRMEWYSLNSAFSGLFFIADYKFDDKRNPFDQSVYWLIMNWKGPDDIVQYFNSNNILSIGFHELYYSYNEKDYPVYMEIPYYGRTTYKYQTR